MKKNLLLMLICSVCMSSCGKDSPLDDLVDGINGGSTDVYFAGYAIPDVGRKSIAIYWKNNEVIQLTDGTQDAEAVHVAISGKDVHVYGYEEISLGHDYSTTIFRHWKNGKVVSDKDFEMANIEDIVISDGDVYIIGRGYSKNTSKASYWKNGEEIILSGGTNKESAKAIFVSGKDVYVAGIEHIYGTWGIPKYWKNGEEVYISDYKTGVRINSIFVSGSDVYIAGIEYSETAKYWKNGKGINLTDGEEDSSANHILVSGNDVYVAGSEWDKKKDMSIAKYWKNGVEVILSDGTEHSEAYSILVLGKDVYAAGDSGYIPQYWKNGKAIHLSKLPIYISALKSIAVAPK